MEYYKKAGTIRKPRSSPRMDLVNLVVSAETISDGLCQSEGQEVRNEANNSN